MAADQSVDQLVRHYPLLVDDGQVQGPVCVGREKRSASQLEGGPVGQEVEAEKGGTDVSPLASWMPHRWRCAASSTRGSPLLQKCKRAAAVWRALADERLCRATAADTTQVEEGRSHHHMMTW